MNASSPSLFPSHAVLHASSPLQRPTSDEIFHLAPLAILDHHTISPVCYSDTHAPDLDQRQVTRGHSIHPLSSPPNPNHPEIRDDISQPLGGSVDDSESAGPSQRNVSLVCSLTHTKYLFLTHAQDSDVHHVVPDPRSAREAYLLLEAARADRRIFLARKSLAHQIIHRNTLVLQYNRMVLERAQDDLHAADRFIGQVHFSIRRCGQSAAFEYAMQEDHSSPRYVPKILVLHQATNSVIRLPIKPFV